MKRRTTTTLSVASFVLLALFLILAGSAYLSGGKVENDSRLISDDAVPGSIDAHAMRAALSGSMRSVAMALVTEAYKDKRANLIVAHRSDVEFQKAVDDYRATIHINPAQDHLLLDKLTARFAEFTLKREAFEARILARDQPGAMAIFEHELLPAFGAASLAADELVAYNHANTTGFAQAIADNIHTLRFTVLVVLGLAVISGAILSSNLAIRRRERDELRENERRLRLTLDNLFASVVLCEPDGTIIEANQAALAAASLPRESVTGRSFDQIPWWAGSRDSQAKLRAALAGAATGRIARFDLEGDKRGANEHAVTVDFGCGPIHATGGRVIHLVASWIDISDRKTLEQHLLRAQRMEAIGTLSSGLAHDLNNILAPMVMAGGLLRMKLTTPRDQEMVAMIETSAQRGADIIRQLLKFGRGTDGIRTNVELRYLIKEMANIIHETFPRDIELVSKVEPDLWPIVADTTQLHQMLLNLCVNARDAMPRGGKLFVLAENLHLREERAAVPPGRYVQLTVTDTGEGIPREIIDRIFDPFFTTKPEGKGTGLGLSSVLGIVKAHGGFLAVDSKPGQGSTFTINLPAAEKTETIRTETVVDHLPRGNGELVLLVDDEVAMRESTKDILEMHNYRILVASNGDEALKQFMANRDEVKVVVTDLDMPVMNGAELIRSLRVLDREVKFVVMTGSMPAGKREELEVFALRDILTKPCDPARLLKALHQML